MDVRRGIASVVLLAPLTIGGCAHITTTSEVEVIAKKGGQTRTFGSPHGRIADRGLAATWTQELDMFEVQLDELRTCEQVPYEPVVRVHRTRRKPDAGFWVEWGLGGGLLGVGIAGLVHPEFLSSSAVNPQGEVVQDTRSGYRLAAIFGAIGVALVTAAIIDTFRQRDSVTYVDAYRSLPGRPVECQHPRGPLADTTVSLHVDEWTSEVVTDARGIASFRLPPESELPGNSPHQRAGFVHGETTVHSQRAVLRIGPQQALVVQFVSPYGATFRRPYQGTAERLPGD